MTRLRPHPRRSRRSLRMSMAYPLASPLPHRHDARHVHARRLHARDRDATRTGPSCTAFDTSRRSAAASTCARARRRGADRRHARRRFGGRPGVDAARLHRRRQPVGPAVEAKQVGTRPSVGDLRRARARRRRSSTHTTFGLGAIARGYAPTSEVWNALASSPGLAVVDSTIVPRRDNFGTSRVPARLPADRLLLRGRHVRPDPGRRCATRRPATAVALTVIGVLKDTAPLEMAASRPRRRRSPRLPGPRPTRRSTTSRSRPASTPRTRRPSLESAFLANGWRPSRSSRSSTTRVAASLTFNRLILGFMGLGLVVGVAALGVISARAVVERRQQIGVLRAIGFRRRHGAGGLPARVVVRRADRRSSSAPRSGCCSPTTSSRDTRAAAELGEPRARRALGQPRGHLRRRLRRRAARDAGAGGPGLAHRAAEALRYE